MIKVILSLIIFVSIIGLIKYRAYQDKIGG